MKKGICETNRELLLDENLERFNKLWGNSGKETGVEKRKGIIGLNVFLRRQEEFGVEASSVVMTLGATPHPVGRQEGR